VPLQHTLGGGGGGQEEEEGATATHTWCTRSEVAYADVCVYRCVSQWHALVQACRVLAEALPGLCRLHALDSDALLPDEVRRMLTYADVC
jgi:hypothetical protein